MIHALAAEGPHPDHADELMLFGRFVGRWDMEGALIAPDGTREEHRGQWHFGWVLEGRAIQDVLVVPPIEYGTTVRFYDPSIDAWRITWITPPNGAVRQLIARPVGDDIVLEGREPDGTLLRWTFTEIAGDRFLWSGYVSDDEGASWRRNEEMRLQRVPGAV